MLTRIANLKTNLTEFTGGRVQSRASILIDCGPVGSGAGSAAARPSSAFNGALCLGDVATAITDQLFRKRTVCCGSWFDAVKKDSDRGAVEADQSPYHLVTNSIIRLRLVRDGM